MTIVPLLTLIFTREHFPQEHILHMAIATATATIVFTVDRKRARTSRARSGRFGRCSGDWRRACWSVHFLGPQIVGGMSTTLLSARVRGVRRLHRDHDAVQSQTQADARAARQRRDCSAAASCIGMVASLVGAGGGFLSVPLMTSCNVRIRNAVGTSAALGLPIAARRHGRFHRCRIASDRPAAVHRRLHLSARPDRHRCGEHLCRSDRGAVRRIDGRSRSLRRAFACLLYAVAAFFLWKALAR